MANGIRIIEQKLTAGNDWTGALPATELARGDHIEFYPESVVGGLFTPDPELSEPLLVRSVELKLGGQTVWTMHKRDRDGDEVLFLCGTDETDFITTVGESVVISKKQSLVLRSTGASAKMIARISLQSTV
jgi:hypothetical protein